jgi:predicted DNA binding CopG/RHH family protein
MSDPQLSSEEQALLSAVEAGEYESVLTEARKKELETAAAYMFNNDQCINIRLSKRDMQAIQIKAAQEGIPYQTLTARIIHKYLSGALIDISANRKNEHVR